MSSQISRHLRDVAARGVLPLTAKARKDGCYLSSIFTVEEVINLDLRQRDTRWPALCCPSQHDAGHPGPRAVLVPTVRGWICQFCDYANGEK